MQSTMSLLDIDFESEDEFDTENSTTVNEKESYEQNFHLKGWRFVNEESITYDFECSDSTINVPVNCFNNDNI